MSLFIIYVTLFIVLFITVCYLYSYLKVIFRSLIQHTVDQYDKWYIVEVLTLKAIVSSSRSTLILVPLIT